ncbi:hypothetical protein RHMOL_Rhmol08G0279100 [Rhododendron molle]|uniref:Uncharacterized protein n=1 Tax=Rhododendron molle TaxID=49168 RepID=A0ACC0MT77_RHOML|nr:hypothetical protein RHMOL_Rhmol08G0279100 [Rhododendron molle]
MHLYFFVVFETYSHVSLSSLVRIDFHLVQFFFACMPSLAVYLVAQYARYEMRRMEAVRNIIPFVTHRC